MINFLSKQAADIDKKLEHLLDLITFLYKSIAN